VGVTSHEVWTSYAPALLTSAGVALAVAAVRIALVPHAPTLLTFAAELVAGALALTLCIRFCPLPATRRELRMRVAASELLGAVGSLRWRLGTLVLGPTERPS
jgi:hypothetical protein